MTQENDSNKRTAAHVANYIIFLAKEHNIDLTPLKLIKLCYISYAWYYFIFNKSLFQECPEAWRYGPVFPTLYAEFKGFKGNPINRYITDISLDGEEDRYPIIEQDDNDASTVIFSAFEAYKDKSGERLTEITHTNEAWKSAYAQGERTRLDKELIKKGAKIGLDRYILAKGEASSHGGTR